MSSNYETNKTKAVACFVLSILSIVIMLVTEDVLIGVFWGTMVVYIIIGAVAVWELKKGYNPEEYSVGDYIKACFGKRGVYNTLLAVAALLPAILVAIIGLFVGYSFIANAISGKGGKLSEKAGILVDGAINKIQNTEDTESSETKDKSEPRVAMDLTKPSARKCALCVHFNGSIGCKSIQPVMGNQFKYAHNEKGQCHKFAREMPAWGTCPDYVSRYPE